jgi:hypothetical protein
MVPVTRSGTLLAACVGVKEQIAKRPPNKVALGLLANTAKVAVEPFCSTALMFASTPPPGLKAQLTVADVKTLESSVTPTLPSSTSGAKNREI